MRNRSFTFFRDHPLKKTKPSWYEKTRSNYIDWRTNSVSVLLRVWPTYLNFLCNIHTHKTCICRHTSSISAHTWNRCDSPWLQNAVKHKIKKGKKRLDKKRRVFPYLYCTSSLLLLGRRIPFTRLCNEQLLRCKWNNRTNKIFGTKTAKEMTGRHCGLFVVPTEDNNQLPWFRNERNALFGSDFL